MTLPSVVTPGTKVQILGAYCNYNGNSWNPDSGQPNVQAWFAGRQDFQTEVGCTLNGGNIFCGSLNAQLNGNISNAMSLVNQVYTNPPYDYIPSIGCKLFQVGEISPSTGKAYVWNDAQAYTDVANGLWDKSWTGIVDAMVANKRFIWFQRVAYEGNAGFMQDFSGYDNQPGQQTPWIAAMRHVFMTIRNYAATKGCYPLIGFNPTVENPGGPTVQNLFTGIGVDVQNVIQIDNYNGYWGMPAAQIPADNSGTVAGVGPTQANLVATWNNQNGGFGWNQVSAMALKYGMPIAIMECGSSGSEDHTLDDPYFFPWLASAIAAHRKAGGTVLTTNIWSVPAGDGNTSVQYGAQPDTLKSLQGCVSGLVGDSFDPTEVPFGGAFSITAPVLSPTYLFGTASGTPYSITATKVGGAFKDAQYSSNTIAQGISYREAVAPVVRTYSTTNIPNDTVTFSSIQSGSVGTNNHQAVVKDSDGTKSPITLYSQIDPTKFKLIHVAYSDGSPTVAVLTSISATGSYTVVQPPAGPQPNETVTVTPVDTSIAPVVSSNAPGAIVQLSAALTITYSDGTTPVVVPLSAADANALATVNIVQPPPPPLPPQTTTVAFSDGTASIVTTNPAGTTVTFS